MKKFLTLLLITVMALSLSACSKGKEIDCNNKTNNECQCEFFDKEQDKKINIDDVYICLVHSEKFSHNGKVLDVTGKESGMPQLGFSRDMGGFYIDGNNIIVYVLGTLYYYVDDYGIETYIIDEKPMVIAEYRNVGYISIDYSRIIYKALLDEEVVPFETYIGTWGQYKEIINKFNSAKVSWYYD